jgi:plastocyanin
MSLRLGLGLAGFVLLLGAAFGAGWLKEELSWRQAEAKDIPGLSEADIYVGDFKYFKEVTIGPDGFSVKKLSVKPMTKVIFTGTGEEPHRVALAPGSKSPKHFDPRIDLTSHSVFQTKLEAVGTYTFTDTYNAAARLEVIVEK